MKKDKAKNICHKKTMERYQREDDAMSIAVKLQEQDNKFIEEMQKYLKELQSKSPEEAKQEAQEALLRTGVTTKSGKLKKSIVSWE